MYLKTRFNFYQNDKLVINNENLLIIYAKKDKILEFKINEFNHKISFKNNFCYFERKNKDYIFKINFKRKIAFLKLNNYNELVIKVIKSEFICNNKEIKIKYILESDIDCLNYLHIELKEGFL